MLTKEKHDEMVDTLAEFVKRIAEKEEATPAELDAMARVANILMECC